MKVIGQRTRPPVYKTLTGQGLNRKFTAVIKVKSSLRSFSRNGLATEYFDFRNTTIAACGPDLNSDM